MTGAGFKSRKNDPLLRAYQTVIDFFRAVSSVAIALLCMQLQLSMQLGSEERQVSSSCGCRDVRHGIAHVPGATLVGAGIDG